jgi:hypothetical protein
VEGANPTTESRGLMELLGRAVLDPEVRNKLFKEPDLLATQYGLAPKDAEALKRIDRAKIEEAASQIASRSEVTIAIVIRIKF